MAVSLVVAALAARPLYREAKKWRAHKLLAEAEAEISRGNDPEALRLLRLAVQMAPNEIAPLRATGEFYERRGNPEALRYYRTMIEHPTASDEGRRKFARMALNLNAVSLAAPILEEMEKSGASDPDFLLLKAELSLRSGNFAEVANVARQIEKANPSDQTLAESQLLLVRALLGETPLTAEKLTEAVAILQSLSKRPDRLGVESLLLLGAIAGSDADAKLDVAEISARLLEHPAAKIDEQLHARTLSIRSAPERRSEILASVLDGFESKPDADQLAILRWLMRQGEAARLLQLLPESAAMRSQERFLLHLDALAALRKWEELRERLGGPGTELLDSAIVHLFQARVAEELHQEERAELEWVEVLRAVRGGGDPKVVQYIAGYAERTGHIGEAIAAYRRLAGIEGQKAAAHEALLRLMLQHGSTRELRDFLQELAGEYPERRELVNDISYLNLLLNEHVEPSMESAKGLVAQSPELPSYRVTLALAHLRAGNATEARAVLDAAGIDWTKAAAPWRAIYAAVLSANGDNISAREMRARIPSEQLRPEERALLERTEP